MLRINARDRDVFATLAEPTPGVYWRTSFHLSMEECLERAHRMQGIVAIEKLTHGIVWQRLSSAED